jgi:predicted nuclease of predicted toxin-antitoxin system
VKLLLDAQLPPTLCRWFEEQGHEAVHAQDLPDPPVTDEFIAILAEHEGLVVVSKDEDFLRLHQRSQFQLLWLRCGNITNRALRAWLEDRWTVVEIMLEAGEDLVELR